ncbi:oxidoreductase [Pseudoalteromonas mariniglutinosa]|uniref:oxidoreductase n=1 Tax=Pseudoalteromonas mariniglutinosa TaxID=206042 RepID=UPI00384EC412
MSTLKTIFITGVSSGFGRAIAYQALQAGHKVIGTVRNPEDLKEFEVINASRAFGRILDVRNADDINKIVAEVESTVGPVDVLINNAGYGHEGIMEESSMEEIRHQFDVNVFGCIAMIKAVVPFMRQRRQGRILNITSMGGYITMPGISDYCGSKFAMVGISESLSKELYPFNIYVTSVAPGSFRTDWAGRSMVRTPRKIADYDKIFDPIRQAREEKSGNQLGDPVKAANAILNLINAEQPPAHLILGSDAFELIRNHIDSFRNDMNSWESLTRSTDG